MNGIRIDPQRLLLERCRCGLSQAALARKARLAYLTVSRIERGHAARVRAITAYKLAPALEVDIEALMSAHAPPASQTDKVADVVWFEPATRPAHARRDDQRAARLVIRDAAVGSPYPVRMRASPQHLATDLLESAERIEQLLGARHG